MSAAQDAITSNELIDRASELVPMLAHQAAECERDRSVAPAVIEALRDAGLFQALQPTQFGGFEMTVGVMLEIGRQLGRGCGSTGWVYGVFSNHQWMMGLFPEQAQSDVWGDDPHALVSGSYAPAGTVETVAGGYQLTGSWGFASGCDHARWHLAGAMLPSAEPGLPPAPGLVLIPREDFRIEDDWFTVGLAGTGSKDVVVDGAFVPSHRTVTYSSMAAGGAMVHASPLYRLPFATVVPVGILGSVLGMTQGAIDDFAESTRSRVSGGGATRGASKAAESESVQGGLAAAAGWLSAADRVVRDDLDLAGAAVAAGEQVSVDHRLRCRRDYSMAVDLCVQAVNALFANSGARGTHMRNPVQRAWRDVNVAARHIGLSWETNRLPFGRHALGLEPQGQY